jgi:hypothetical protein
MVFSATPAMVLDNEACHHQQEAQGERLLMEPVKKRFHSLSRPIQPDGVPSRVTLFYKATQVVSSDLRHLRKLSRSGPNNRYKNVEHPRSLECKAKRNGLQSLSLR